MATNLALNVELDVEFADAVQFAAIATNWIDSLASDFGGEPWLPFAEPPRDEPPPPSGSPVGPPGSLQATVEVRLRAEPGERNEVSRPYGESSLWLQDKLLQLPELVSLEFVRLNDDGQWGTFGLSLDVRSGVESPGWMRLQSYVPEAAFTDPGVGVDNQRRWLSALRTYANGLNPGFGQVAYAYSDGATALEARLKGFHLHYRDPAYTVGESRTLLRGYGWLTIIPEELLGRLGGLSILENSDAFTEVSPLDAGGAWLQATDDYREFNDERLERVFRALAPVIRPGLPRPMLNPYPGKPPFRLVYEDAAAASNR